MSRRYPYIFSFVLHFCSLQPLAAKPIVVTNIRPIQLIVEQLSQDYFKVVNLVPPNASPHFFELNPSQFQAVEKSDLFIYIDESLDSWILHQGIEVKNKLRLLGLVKNPVVMGRPASVDPHIWMGPKTIQALLPLITEELCRITNQSACDKFRVNQRQMETEIETLIAEIQTQVEALNEPVLLAAHPFLNYFARDFGLAILPPIEWISGKESSAKRLIAVIKEIKDKKIKAIFREASFADKAIEVILKETQIQSVLLDPLGSSSDVKTYPDLIRSNANKIKEALK